MKQYIKNIIMMTALLLASAGAWADGNVIKVIQKAGQVDATAGTVESSVSNGVCTLTVTPATGNFIKADFITVLKIVDGSEAQARRMTPGLNTEPIALTAADATADPSGVTVYTFTMPASGYDVEVTANFQERTSINGAVVTLSETSYTYDGTEKKPSVLSVVLGNVTIGSDNYTVAYSNNIEPAQATDNVPPTVVVTAKGIYTGTATANFSIEKASAGLAFSATTATATYGSAFTAPELQNANKLTVAYSSSNAEVATVNAETGVVTLVGSGKTTITATFAGNSQYAAASASYELTVSAAAAGLAFSAATATATYGSAFTAPELQNANKLTVTYSSSNAEVATVNVETGVVTLVGSGKATITATFAGNSQYAAASASYELTVSAAAAGLAFSAATATATYGSAFTAPELQNAHRLTVAYSSSNAEVATVNAETGVVTLVGSGKTTITATFAGNSQYAAASASYELTVSAAAAGLAFSAATATATYGSAFTAPELQNANKLTVTYSTSNAEVATVNAETGVVTLVGSGKTTITASFAGNSQYAAASASYELTVSAAAAGLAFSAATATATYGSAFTAPELQNAHKLTVAYSSSNAEVATVNAETGVVTLVGSGKTTITATFAGNNQYAAASASYELTVSAAAAGLAFSAATATATYGSAFTAPELQNAHQLTIAYSSSNAEVATVNAETGVVTLVGSGKATITATFAGNSQYAAASASYELTVSAAAAGLAFSAATATATYGSAFTAPELQNAHKLTIAYSSSNAEVATVNAETGVVTLVGSGKTTITATFAGNSQYAAASASYELTVSAAAAGLAFSATTATATYGSAFTAPELQNAHKLTVAYSSSNAEVATVNAETGVVTLVGSGKTTITATFAGNSQYAAASASYELTVSAAAAGLAFSAATASATYGSAFTAPELQNANKLTVAYSSSNAEVATVNAETGVVTLVGSGKTTITATFAGNSQYAAASASYELTVSAAAAGLAFSAATATATYGSAFTAPELQNAHRLTVTYSSSNAEVATVNAETGVVTLVGSGKTTITATFAGNNQYAAASASYELTVSAAAAGLAFSAATATATYGSAFTAPELQNVHKLTVTYSSSNAEVATVNAETGVVTLVGSGKTTITATFAGNSQYAAASASYELTVSAAAAGLAFSAATATATYGSAFTAPELQNVHKLTVAYSSSNAEVATVNAETGVVTLVGSGKTTITATFAGNSQYAAASASYELTVSAAAAGLAFSAATATATYGSAFTAPELQNAHKLTVAYSSSNAEVATVNAETGVVTLVGSGKTTITATFAGNSQYAAASASYELTVSAAAAGLAFSAATATATYGSAFTAPELQNAHKLTVAYSSSNAEVATVNAETGVVTLVGSGKTTITATFAGNSQYAAASASYELTVSAAAAGLAFSAATATATYGSAFTAPELQNAHKLTVAYSSSNAEVATVNAETGVVTLVGSGKTTITATFAGNSQYAAASASYELTVSAAAAGLAFSAATATATYGSAFTAPELQNAHKLTVAYSSSNAEVATVNAETGVVTLVGSGKTTITATFAGNSQYAAASASYELTVSAAAAGLAFSAATATATYGSAFTAPELQNAHKLTVTYSSSNAEVATVNAEMGVVTLVGSGKTTITATFAGNSQYAAASASYELTVSAAAAGLAFSAATASATYGSAFTAPELQNANKLTVAYSSSNAEVATVNAETGVVTLVGSGKTTITATFAGNSQYAAASASYELTVSAAAAGLAFSATTATATYGSAFTAPELQNAHKLTIAYSSSNAEVATVNAETGVVTLVGSGKTTITATFAGNSQYAAASASYELTVSAAAAGLAFSAATATATYGSAFTAPELQNAHQLTVAYSSSNAEVATVNAETGVVTLVGSGKTTITATFAGNSQYAAASASYELIVSAAATGLAFSAATASATYGSAFTAPELQNAHKLTVTYSSSNAEVATVNAETGVVTLVGSGKTTITATFAGNSQYAAASASYELTVSAPATGLAFPTAVVSVVLNAEFEAPVLKNPNNLPVTYSSWNTKIATVDAKTGAVSILKEGTTTIQVTFAGNDKFLADSVSYKIEVTTPKSINYDLWIGDKQVTSDNKDDVLGDYAEDRSAPSVVFSTDGGKYALVLTDAALTEPIKSGLSDSLKIYLIGSNTISVATGSAIAHTGAQRSALMFTKSELFAGTLTMQSGDASVITGFSDLSFEQNLMLISPLNGTYANGMLVDPLGVAATSATIQAPINPIVEDTKVEFPADNFTETDEVTGETEDLDLTNTAIDDLLYTLNQDADDVEGSDGYDDEENCIVLNNVQDPDEVDDIIDDYVPGTPEYADQFTGITFLIPAGTGFIEIEFQTFNGNRLHVKIGDNDPIEVVKEDRDTVWIPYEVEVPTYVRIYNVGTGVSAARDGGNVFRAKKTLAQIKIYSVTVKPGTLKSSSSSSVQRVASSYPAEFVPEKRTDLNITITDDPGIGTGITTVGQPYATQPAEGWYTLSGQRIAEPKKKGLYIFNGRKVMVK